MAVMAAVLMKKRRKESEEVNKMGMYDWVDGITAYCPQCGKQLGQDFQTKDFEDRLRFLNHYKPGDTLPKERESESSLQIYSICKHCNLFTNIFLIIEDDILTDKMC